MNSAGFALNEVSSPCGYSPIQQIMAFGFLKRAEDMVGIMRTIYCRTVVSFAFVLQIANCYPCNDSLHFIDLRGGVVVPHRWHHLAAIYNASTGTGSLYVNGVLVASESKGSGLAYYTTTEPPRFRLRSLYQCV